MTARSERETVPGSDPGTAPAGTHLFQRLGYDAGRLTVPEDFDAPLPDALLAPFD
jgi:hypothetical protein